MRSIFEQSIPLANFLEIENNLSRRRIYHMAMALAAPNVAGYSFDQAPNLSNAEERRKLSENAIKVFVNITKKWDLNEVQARGLLGGVASSTFHAWKTKPKGKKLDQDTLTRISLVIGIYKALSIYFGKPWADRWITLKNRGPLFAGQTPIDYMLRHGQPGMAEVCRMLDAWRGGR
jgi:hypothetical protein